MVVNRLVLGFPLFVFFEAKNCIRAFSQNSVIYLKNVASLYATV